MAVITQDMRTVIQRAMVAYVATVCRDGSPNLCPPKDPFSSTTTITWFS